MTWDFLTSAVSFVLTVMILSYLIGDSVAFRIAVHIFTGVAAGYVAAVAWWQVLFPKLVLPALAGSAQTRAMLAVPLLLSGMLLMKGWPPLSRLGNPAMGVLVGAAAAVALGGAIQGTLLPQASATVETMDPQRIGSLEGMINGILVMIGALSSLIYFHFSARTKADRGNRRPAIIEASAALGALFLAVTLGVLFSGVYSAALTAFIERLRFIGSFLGLV